MGKWRERQQGDALGSPEMRSGMKSILRVVDAIRPINDGNTRACTLSSMNDSEAVRCICFGSIVYDYDDGITMGRLTCQARV